MKTTGITTTGLLICVLLLFSLAPASGQVRKYSNEFLSIGVGARGMAMSGAQVASVDDVTAGYWNPAGLAQVKHNFQGSFMHAEYFAGIAKYDYGSIVIPMKDKKRFLAGEPGVGKEGTQYLIDKQVVAVGADTWAVEVIPFEKGVGVFEVHQILLARNGVFILENMDTSELVKDKAWEFMFTLGASRITGGVQAIINPVAIR